MNGPALHPRAWLLWLAGALALLSLARNPVVLALVLLSLAAVSSVLAAQAAALPGPRLPLLRLAVWILLLSALLNALTSHVGRTVLFTLPVGIPMLGGPVTLEALAYGALNGLALLGFLLAFRVLYQALPVQALVHMIPRGLYPVAVVISIALTFVPASLAQWQQIRAAQTLRGHRVRGLRDALPLLMPLLVGGLERALQLAEAMTARGFGSLGIAKEKAQTDWLRLGMAAGLVLLLAGLLALLFWQQPVVGWAAVAGGGALVWGMLLLQGSHVQRTVYRRQRWNGRARAMALASVLTLAVTVWGARHGLLAYSPYPALSAPRLPWLLLAGLLPGLLAPLWTMGRSMRRSPL